MKITFNRSLLLHKLQLNLPEEASPLLQQALTHKSVLLDKATRHFPFNERLEFLGDAILKASISSWLFEYFPHFSEGQMTKVRSYVVSDVALAQVAIRIGLQEHLILGKSEQASGGYNRESILASAFEALCGAVFLSSDYSTTAAMIIRLVQPELDIALEGNSQHVLDYKGMLQEFSQDKYKCRPEYLITDREGPSHHRLFTVQVKLCGEILGEGSGLSKKKAEQESAQQALKNLDLLPEAGKSE